MGDQTDQTLARLVEIEQQLTGSGAPFETREEDVLGERMTVFANRQPHLRAILAASEALGDREYVVVDDGRRITYAQNLRNVASVAAALRDTYGVGPGDRVAILAANCPEWITTFWAAVSLGAIAVGMNAWWAADEITYGIADADPTVLVADRRRLERLSERDLAAGVPVVEIEKDFLGLLEHAPDAALPDVDIAEDDPAAILYTSGTTGRPKGVVNSHRNIIALTGIQIFSGMRMAVLSPPPIAEGAPAQRVQLVGNPLFHVSGLYTHVVTFLMTGIKTVWTTGRFDPAKVLRLIEDEGVTGWSPMGSMAVRLLDHPGLAEHDLSRVVTLGSGGSPMPPYVQDRLRKAFPNAAPALGVGYGLTEATALISLCSGPELERHPDSVGRPLPTVEVEIRDPGGTRVADGDEGYIWTRSPLVMLGYWRNPEATAESIDPHRWLLTGDIGRFADGRLYVNARARDMILRAGENVYPAEIEQRIEAHPAVDESAVVGVEHPVLGQEVKAIVVLAGDAPSVDGDELAAWVAEGLAYYKVPSLWEIRPQPLPRNASGKVLKHVLTGDAPNPFVEE